MRNQLAICMLGVLVWCGLAIGQIQFNDRTVHFDVGGNANPSGVVFLDYNNDDLEDIFIVTETSTASNMLLKNRGNANTFEVVTSEANLTLTVQGYAATIGDYNNDGWEDIFTSYHYNHDNQIYKNLGGSPVSYSPLASQILGDNDNAGATWLDYNRDGLLDLFLMDPHGIYHENGAGFWLYENLGNDIFQLDASFDIEGAGECVVAADYDNDGDTDLYITGYDQTNSESTYLEYDAQAGEFDEKRNAGGALNSGITQAQGVAAGDYNNDGYLDLFIANDGGIAGNCQDRFYLNDGDGTFTEDAALGIMDDSLSYSPQFADFDNDGWLDVYVVKMNAVNRLYHNDGDGTFTDISGTIDPIRVVGRSSAIGDVNNDGKLDIYIGNNGSSNILLVNSTSNNNHYLKIKLVGTQSNRSALNARVMLYDSGVQYQMREITGSSGYMSQNSKIVHFGLGSQSQVPETRIKWPSGIQEIAYSLDADQLYTIVEGAPSAPQSLTISGGSGDHPGLNWNPPPEGDVKEYLIYRNVRWSRFNQTGWEYQANTTQTNWEDFNFLIGGPIATAYYKVIAQDLTNQNSGYSNTVSVVGAPGMAKPGQPLTESNEEAPNSFQIHENYPNPFNPSTRIRYELPIESNVSLIVHNISGKIVKTIVTESQSAGRYEIQWNGQDDTGNLVSTGMYFARIQAGSYSHVIKMIYMR